MGKMDSKGQTGAVWFWLSSLIGVMFVITIYIVFDVVLWDSEVGLGTVLNQSFNLDLGSAPIVALRTSWDIWAIALVFAWFLAMIVKAIVKESDVGFR